MSYHSKVATGRPPCHPSTLLNPSSLRRWRSLLILLIAPPRLYCLSPTHLSSAYSVIHPVALSPAVEQSLMLLLPAKATAQCRAVLVMKSLFNTAKGNEGGCMGENADGTEYLCHLETNLGGGCDISFSSWGEIILFWRLHFFRDLCTGR